MKKRSEEMPQASFKVVRIDAGLAEVIFYENVSSEDTVTEDGTAVTMWEYEEYRLTRPYYPNLEADIAANYAPWIDAARRDDIIRNNDIVQNRADIDYLLALNS